MKKMVLEITDYDYWSVVHDKTVNFFLEEIYLKM